MIDLFTPSFEAVFFDMDGTLIDTEPFWLESENELMGRFGYQWQPDDQRICLGGPLSRVGRYMHEKAGGESPEYFERELVSLVHQRFLREITFMPGAKDLLIDVRNSGIPIGLVSASPRLLMDAALNHIDEDFFDITISANDVSKSKPDPQPYLRAAAAIGVVIEKSLILEDSLTGISAAQASGAWVLAIPHIVKVEPQPRTVIIESLDGVCVSEISTLFMERMAQ